MSSMFNAKGSYLKTFFEKLLLLEHFNIWINLGNVLCLNIPK